MYSTVHQGQSAEYYSLEAAMKATAEIQIDKPINDVWSFVSNIENMDRWVDGIEAPKQTSESETGKGTIRRVSYLPVTPHKVATLA